MYIKDSIVTEGGTNENTFHIKSKSKYKPKRQETTNFTNFRQRFFFIEVEHFSLSA